MKQSDYLSLPDKKFLEDIIDYNPETGLAFFKHRPTNHFTDGAGRYTAKSKAKSFNIRFAGKQICSTNKAGYIKMSLLGKKYFLHRLVWKMHYGEDPYMVDHINGVRTDNRIDNLASTDRNGIFQNSKIPKNNKTGVRGVYLDCGKWRAFIYKNSKKFELGSFEKFDDAVLARASAEKNMNFGLRKPVES